MKTTSAIPFAAALLCLGANGVQAQAKTPAKKVAATTAVAKSGGNFGAINVAGVSIAKLDSAAAKRRLTRELKGKLAVPIVVSNGRRRVTRKRSDLGARLDLGWMLARAATGQKSVPLHLSVDQNALRRALDNLAPRFETAPRSAGVVESRGRIKIVRETPASRVDVGASVKALAPKWEQNAALRELRLKTIEKTPTLTAARLKGITGRIGTFTTEYNAAKVKRSLNMKLAIREVNNTLLSPGEVFSLNGVVGERTQARGYRTSIVFQNGYKVPGVGAGVSQVTGTLFNAALVAGLPIVTYKTHSRPVAYLPIGRDATVSWGDFDMKFKNNTNAPILIKYGITGSTTTATLYGRKTPGQAVSLRVLKQQKGPRLITAQLYRTIRRKGRVVSKQKIGTSIYKWNVGKWEE